MELIYKLFPNVVEKSNEFIQSIYQTLYMVGISFSISFIIGLALGIVLVATRKNGIMQNRFIYFALDKIVNIFRVVPFIILLAALIPLTRLIVGSAIGTKGAIVPLVFGTVPFFARQVEASLLEMDNGIIEAAQSMGNTGIEIIFRVYLVECIPSLVRASTITIISLVGLTAMAGAVGAGGLGDFAIRYGHMRNQIDATYATMIVMIMFVVLIQWIGNYIIKKTSH